MQKNRLMKDTKSIESPIKSEVVKMNENINTSKILLVDDERDITNLLEEVLRQDAFRIS